MSKMSQEEMTQERIKNLEFHERDIVSTIEAVTATLQALNERVNMIYQVIKAEKASETP